MSIEDLRIPVEALSPPWKIEDLAFETTEDIPPLEGTIGQERAVTALEFGLNIHTPGYNVYVAGQPGTGRNTTLANYLEQTSHTLPPPPDWCYVHNFDDPSRPRALSLPAGTGAQLSADLTIVVEACQKALPRAFEGPEYQEKLQEVLEDINAQRAQLTAEMEQMARQEGVALQFTAMGIASTPLTEEGRPMDREAYDRLPEEEKQAVRERRRKVQEYVQERVATLQRLDKTADQRKAEADREVAEFAVRPAFDELRERYAQFPKVIEYLERVEADVVAHVDEFRSAPQDPQAPPQLREAAEQQRFVRYRVNVVINNRGVQGAPVVFEYSPTYYNLFGRIEYRTSMGGAFTDLTMIRPGAIHRANGGFLICQARDLLGSPFAWETMKRVLRSREARIENLGEQASAVPFSTLNPEPIPLNAKIILVGPPALHRMLQMADEDFHKFFKVKADFDVSMDNTPENVSKYASFVVNRVRQEGLRHFDRGAVARVVEYSCRLVEDRNKLTTRFVDVADLITEANFWAEHDEEAPDGGSPLVRAEHVEQAARARVARSNLPEERLRKLIKDGTIHIATEGALVGQVNGLAVMDLGDYMFGSPSRVSARIALGGGDVANIEYEAKMAGPIHNKGFMILVGYLMGKFGREKPMALRATIGFEQTYSEVEGDSAASTELYSLLSSLADIPINQSFAVTGSVNQNGEVQAVGGVTPKVEGFFDVCRVKGLTGEQGVLIPRDNVNNLVLRRDVVDAVREGKFRIYGVSTIEEGIEILTGVPAGVPQADGTYPGGTLFAAVDATLRNLADRSQQRTAPAPSGNARRSGRRRNAPSDGDGKGDQGGS